MGRSFKKQKLEADSNSDNSKQDMSVTSFRSRLGFCNEETKESMNETKPANADQDLNDQFRKIAEQGDFPFAYCSHQPGMISLQTSDGVTDLADAFAQTAVELRRSNVENLVQIHDTIAEKITCLGQDNDKSAIPMEKLYDSIGFPLSATLCHDAKRETATIDTHLSVLQSQLQASQEELEKLRKEWIECNASEEALRQDFAAQIALDRRAKQLVDPGEFDMLHAEVTKVASDMIDAIDTLDREFHENFQSVTMTMMQCIFED